jgi:16S rRNA (guanine527-N7)-methyltransferase
MAPARPHSVVPQVSRKEPPQNSKRLLELLALARDRGFAGKAPPEEQLERSLAFSQMVAAPSNALDLGSGAGLPGLVLALHWPSSNWCFLESKPKRAAWLRHALAVLELQDRCQVAEGRAEHLARTCLRGSFDLVTARAFGPPAATAECGAAFLAFGGRMIVAEPPLLPSSPPALVVQQVTEDSERRWPARGLAQLGLRLDATGVVPTSAGPVTLSRLVCYAPCPELYPRRVGAPFKRPLF